MSGIQELIDREVGELCERFKEEMEVRSLRYRYTAEHIQQELIWFREFTEHRIKLQLRVEPVLALRLKARKEIYKKWREELGDDNARRYAKLVEYFIEKGKPTWFQDSITTLIHTKLQSPSFKSGLSLESSRPSRLDQPSQQSLL